MEISQVKVLHSFMSLYPARIGIGNGNWEASCYCILHFQNK